MQKRNENVLSFIRAYLTRLQYCVNCPLKCGQIMQFVCVAYSLLSGATLRQTPATVQCTVCTQRAVRLATTNAFD